MDEDNKNLEEQINDEAKFRASLAMCIYKQNPMVFFAKAQLLTQKLVNITQKLLKENNELAITLAGEIPKKDTEKEYQNMDFTNKDYLFFDADIRSIIVLYVRMPPILAKINLQIQQMNVIYHLRSCRNCVNDNEDCLALCPNNNHNCVCRLVGDIAGWIMEDMVQCCPVHRDSDKFRNALQRKGDYYVNYIEYYIDDKNHWLNHINIEKGKHIKGREYPLCFFVCDRCNNFLIKKFRKGNGLFDDGTDGFYNYCDHCRDFILLF